MRSRVVTGNTRPDRKAQALPHTILSGGGRTRRFPGSLPSALFDSVNDSIDSEHIPEFYRNVCEVKY